MKTWWCVLLVIASAFAIASCGDGGPYFTSQSKDELVLFKRVTLATDAPDRLEIEIEVRTGPNFTDPAPDGTKVSVETSLGEYEGNGPRFATTTMSGHAVVRLVPPPGPAEIVVTARVDDVEAKLAIVVDEYGSMRLGST
jgi:hypothetical protein